MLELKEICKSFRTGAADVRIALNNVSLSVPQGELVSIIGSNGAGKSTLLRAICGEVSIDSGSVLLDGRNLTQMAPHKRSLTIGRVFQDPLQGTAPAFSIEENLSLAKMKSSERNSGIGSFLRKALKKSDRESFRVLLSELEMGMENRIGTPVGMLSGGQRQALTLLMATFSKPSLLLLDEHCAALDPRTAETVMRVTLEIIRKRGLATLMVTHNMSHALIHSDRIIMMDQGQIRVSLNRKELAGKTIEDLIQLFRMENDRVLLSSERTQNTAHAGAKL